MKYGLRGRRIVAEGFELVRVSRVKLGFEAIATHSPLLMALPCARLLEITRAGLMEIDFAATDHFRLYREFVADPQGFLDAALSESESGNAFEA